MMRAKNITCIFIVFVGVVLLVGCPTLQLKDEVQESNIETAVQNYSRQCEYFRGDIVVTDEDGNETQEPQVPPQVLIDSLWDLFNDMLELERAKAESWEDQARNAGWVKPKE